MTSEIRSRPPHGRCAAFTLTELLAAGLAGLFLLALILPAVADVGATNGQSVSMRNLRTIGVAHACYGAEWNDRQFTATPDDMGVFGSMEDWRIANGVDGPPLLLGWSQGGLWAFWMDGAFPANGRLAEPLRFEDPLVHLGSYVLPNARAVHVYANGRFYDPLFYNPLEDKVFDTLEEAFAVPDEFYPAGATPTWSSYFMSPAAMYHPNVLRRPSAGGFRAPTSFDDGFRSPSVSQVKHPGLKTRFIERSWIVGAPPGCADLLPSGINGVEACPHYLFNQGADATPAAAFFDGSIRFLNTGDVARQDLLMRLRTGVDGLWSRDTPLGDDGFFGELSVDGVTASHHMLTTDGIRGRDTLTTE